MYFTAILEELWVYQCQNIPFFASSSSMRRVFFLRRIISLFAFSSRKGSNAFLSQSPGGKTILSSKNSLIADRSSFRSSALYATFWKCCMEQKLCYKGRSVVSTQKTWILNCYIITLLKHQSVMSICSIWTHFKNKNKSYCFRFTYLKMNSNPDLIINFEITRRQDRSMLHKGC